MTLKTKALAIATIYSLRHLSFPSYKFIVIVIYFNHKNYNGKRQYPIQLPSCSIIVIILETIYCILFLLKEIYPEFMTAKMKKRKKGEYSEIYLTRILLQMPLAKWIF